MALPPMSTVSLMIMSSLQSWFYGRPGGDASVLVAGSRARRGTGIKNGNASPVLPLLSNPELVDDLAVPVLVRPLQVVEEPTPRPDELEQPAARVVVLEVGLEVVGEVADARGEQR